MENKINSSAQLLVTTEGGMLSFGEAAAQFNDTNNGFTHYLEGLQLKHKEFEDFIAEVQKLFNINEYDFSSPMSKSTTYESDEIKIYSNTLNKTVIFDVLTKTIELQHKLFNIYNKRVEIDTGIKVHFHEYFYSGGKLDHKVKFIEATEYTDNTELYYPYIDTDAMFSQFLQHQENILVLLGKPGTGKTKLANSVIKYMLQNPDMIPYDKQEVYDVSEEGFVSVAYIKNEDVLADDSFWRQLENGVFDIVLLDDLDYFLVSRDKSVQSQSDVNKNKFISQLLSYTDGVSKNKTKFIITTNRTSDDTDAAILRKGRLFDILELQDLNFEEALVIWKHYELDEKDFETIYSGVDSILPADLGSEISKRKNKKKITTKSYIKREGVSLVKKAKKTRKVGF